MALTGTTKRIAATTVVASILLSITMQSDRTPAPNVSASRQLPHAPVALEDGQPPVPLTRVDAMGRRGTFNLEQFLAPVAANVDRAKHSRKPRPPNDRRGTHVVRQLRRLVRTALRWSGRDVTETAATRSALVISPHPDDETLGCGATILRKVAAGTPVTVLVVTNGQHSHRSVRITPEQLGALRKAEMTDCGARLGLVPGALRWAGFVDGEVSKREDELVELIASLITELRPQEVYATCAEDGHRDHAVVGRAARRAVAATGVPATLMEYAVWLWNTWPIQRRARIRSTMKALGMVAARRARLVRTAEHLPAKLHALQAHASQLRRPAQVPAHEEWAMLPRNVLSDAADGVELFLIPKHRR